jgi:hypothetical protein
MPMGLFQLAPAIGPGIRRWQFFDFIGATYERFGETALCNYW